MESVYFIANMSRLLVLSEGEQSGGAVVEASTGQEQGLMHDQHKRLTKAKKRVRV